MYKLPLKGREVLAMSWLGIFLLLFGFGCFLGMLYALIFHGIPLFVRAIQAIFAGAREGWHEGGELSKQWGERIDQWADRLKKKADTFRARQTARANRQ
jgi:fatty acid desaturase